MVPYPHPNELDTQPATFMRLTKTLEYHPKLFISMLRGMNFSFLDESSVSNVPLMRRMIPCIQASIEVIKRYNCVHQNALPCDITALEGKQDRFLPTDVQLGWALHTSKKNGFKRVALPGKHMFILSNTAEILKLVCAACKTFNGIGK